MCKLSDFLFDRKRLHNAWLSIFRKSIEGNVLAIVL